MIYNLKYTAASVLAVINMSSAGFTKCADNTPITLFVYGSNINGPPMFFANGKAYFGRGPLIDTTGIQTNITITAGYDSTQPWPITANSTTVSFNETQYLYLVPGSGSFEQLGFATNVSIPIGGVTTGFSWYGKSVAYSASGSDYEFKFFGLATNTTGIYGLYWNNGSNPEGAFPVALKSTPPTIA